MTPSPIMDRLGTLRNAIRRRLLAYGVLVCLAMVAGGSLVLILLDWALKLPPALRIAGIVLFAGGVMAAAAYWVFIPLAAPLRIEHIAGRLERYFPDLQDRLSSSVSFLQQSDAGSAGLTRHVVKNTEAAIGGIAFESVLSWRPVGRCAALVGLSVLVFGLVLYGTPSWVRIGSARYLFPLDDVAWPRRVQIVPLTGTQRVAMGESAIVRMKIERGWARGMRGIVHYAEPGGGPSSLALQRDEDGTFYAVIDAITADLRYWFEAGDDETGRNPGLIRVVRRPEVLEAVADLEPPPYAPGTPLRRETLRGGAVSAPVGGFVTVSVKTNKPVVTDPAGAAGLRLESGGMIPLTLPCENPQALAVRFEVTEDVDFRIELRDEFGFENRGAVRHTIRAIPDRAPVASIVEPTSSVELTPHGSLPVAIVADDDFGTARLALQIERLADGRTEAIDLTSEMVSERDGENVRARADHLWSIEPLQLTPGDVLVYHAEATDNRMTGDVVGQVGRSAAQRIRVISEIEFDGRVRDAVASLENRLRQVMLDEADLRDVTTALRHDEAEPEVLTPVDRESAGVFADRQVRLVRRTQELGRQFGELGVRMAANRSGSADNRRQLNTLREAVMEVSARPMSAAAASLAVVPEQTAARAQQDALQDAVRDQTAAVDTLRRLLQSLAQWGDFQGLVTRTRDLHDRQQSIRTETGVLGKSILGKPVAALSTDEAAALNRVHREQEQLAADVEQLLERMEHLAGVSEEKDPSGQAAIESAIRVARSRDLLTRVRAATEAVADNRTAAATIDQKSAAETIRRILAALQQRELHELARLRKAVEDGETQVAELIEQQEALRIATQEAQLIETGASGFSSLAERQRTLRRNTQGLGADLEADAQTSSAGQIVRSAAAPMRKAEEELELSAPAPAMVDQGEALTLLNRAREQLSELARRMAEQTLRMSLARIREGLETLLHEQRDINKQITSVMSAITERGRLGRSEAREAAHLTRAQTELRRSVDQWLPEFDQVPIFQWALLRVTGWMDESRQRLDARKINAELVEVTGRIVHELERLIGAIDELDALPVNESFAEAEGGGGGAGAPTAPKPVPTLAELLVLKAMQREINGRTRRLSERINPAQAGEDDLRELQRLGEDQSQVRQLTELVTRRARGR